MSHGQETVDVLVLTAGELLVLSLPLLILLTGFGVLAGAVQGRLGLWDAAVSAGPRLLVGLLGCWILGPWMWSRLVWLSSASWGGASG